MYRRLRERKKTKLHDVSSYREIKKNKNQEEAILFGHQEVSGLWAKSFSGSVKARIF